MNGRKENLLNDIASDILGTCDSLGKHIEKLAEMGVNVDEDELFEELLDRNIERCPHCEWWCESHELVDGDGELMGCDNCADKEF